MDMKVGRVINGWLRQDARVAELCTAYSHAAMSRECPTTYRPQDFLRALAPGLSITQSPDRSLSYHATYTVNACFEVAMILLR